jgi:hypothetical protein
MRVRVECLGRTGMAEAGRHDLVPLTRFASARSLFSHARTQNEHRYHGAVPIRAFESEVLTALRGALVDIGLDVEEETLEPSLELADRTWRPDAIFIVNRQRIVIEAKAAVTERETNQLISCAHALSLPMLVASRRIAEGAKERLRSENVGYFDGRGHLRLSLPGVLVDTEVPPMEPVGQTPVAFEGEVVREVAIVLLDEPDAHHGPRSIARVIGRAPSAVSAALDRLRANDLLTSANEPVVPELFWELSAVWRRGAHPLADLPEPGRGSQNALLQLGLHDEVGWALTDTLAARAWGMPIVVSPNYPPDFYVPTIIALQRAAAQFGRAECPEERACTVAVAPVPLVCRWREDRPGEYWKVANHIVVALDIAKDEARGREILERWNPPDGITRVW